MRPSVAVVGSANIDLVARCERLPAPGETLGDATFETVAGGKGANQAVAAARLGAEVRFLGCVGSDTFGDELVDALSREGVDVVASRSERQPTGVAIILVAADGENQIVVAPGANREVVADPAAVAPFDAVLCQLEIPVETVLAVARAAAFFCLNAAPARPLPAELVRHADLVVVNRFEREALPVEPGLTALTLGAEGAVLIERGEEVARAAPPAVEAVDGTGAGDAFCAALVVSLLEGRGRDDALRRACAAGALAASRFGAQPSLPTAAEVEAVLV